MNHNQYPHHQQQERGGSSYSSPSSVQSFSSNRWDPRSAASHYGNPYHPSPSPASSGPYQYQRSHYGQSASSPLTSASPASSASLPPTSSNQPSPYSSQHFSGPAGYAPPGSATLPHGVNHHSSSSHHQHQSHPTGGDVGRLRLDSSYSNQHHGQSHPSPSLSSAGGHGSGSSPSTHYDRQQPGLRIGSGSSQPWHQNSSNHGSSTTHSGSSNPHQTQLPSWNYSNNQPGSSVNQSSHGYVFTPSRLYSNVDHPHQQSSVGEVQLRPPSLTNMRQSYTNSSSSEEIPSRSNAPSGIHPLPPRPMFSHSNSSSHLNLNVSTTPGDAQRPQAQDQGQSHQHSPVEQASGLASSFRRENQPTLSGTTSSGLERAFGGSSGDDRRSGSNSQQISPINNSDGDNTAARGENESSNDGQGLQAGIQASVESAAQRNDEAQAQLEAQNKVDISNAAEEQHQSSRTEEATQQAVDSAQPEASA